MNPFILLHKKDFNQLKLQMTLVFRRLERTFIVCKLFWKRKENKGNNHFELNPVCPIGVWWPLFNWNEKQRKEIKNCKEKIFTIFQ